MTRWQFHRAHRTASGSGRRTRVDVGERSVVLPPCVRLAPTPPAGPMAPHH